MTQKNVLKKCKVHKYLQNDGSHVQIRFKYSENMPLATLENYAKLQLKIIITFLKKSFLIKN